VRERTDTRKDAEKAVTQKVDPKRDAQQGIGKLSVVPHAALDAATG
jgi:hypothetical protein